MKKLWIGMQRFWREEEGATMLEYALLAGLISVVAIATLIALGPEVDRIYQAVLTAFGNVP